MKSITLSNKKYLVPESWDQVTLAMQQKVSEDTEKITIESLKKFAILSGYANIPIDELKRANLNDLTDVFKALEFINEPIPEKEIIEFDFNGKHYYCGQNLVEMQFQDFISIETVLKENSGSTYNALPTIMAIMCKQKKTDGTLETLDDYNVLERSIEFRNLPMVIARNLSLFFSNNMTILYDLIPSFLNQENQQAAIQKRIESIEKTLKQLDGQGLLMHLVAGVLRIYLKHIKRLRDRLYTSTQ